MTKLQDLIKLAVFKAGSYCSVGQVRAMDAMMNYLETGRWLRTQGYLPCKCVDRREQLFDMIAEDVAEKNVLYLEFGVYQGQSIAYWSRLLRNPASHLHGFDSFEGLPETWRTGAKKGLFSTQGEVPKIEDPRVEFFKGWFDDTLPGYVLPEHEQLVVSMDADLYSSTASVLKILKEKINLGTYIYFDEFVDRHHEQKAFDEFLESTSMKFRLVAATRTFVNVVFQRVA